MIKLYDTLYNLNKSVKITNPNYEIKILLHVILRNNFSLVY